MNTSRHVSALARKYANTKRLKDKIRHKKRFLIFLHFFSSVVEYYDFFTFTFIFFYLIGKFSHQTIEVYGITIISLTSFLFRPLGYRMQIWLTRYYSRKTIIFINGIMMTVSIIIPGLITGMESSPWLTCGIILISRILNGISFGIKLQSNVTYIKYFFPKRLHYAIANSTLGAQFGLTLSIFITHLLSAHLSVEELNLGWRIPFFIGGILSLILFIMRIATYSRLKSLTDKAIYTPLDKIAFHAGRNLWLGLLVSSAKACLTFTVFVSIPSILGWTLKFDITYITQIMFIATILSTFTSWCFKHYFNPPRLIAINFALICTLILTVILGYAILHDNRTGISISICALAILNGYLFITVPELIECTLPERVKFESMLFINNYEYFHFNVIRRLGMFIALLILGTNLNTTYFIGVLIGSIWITIIPSILAVMSFYTQNKNVSVNSDKLT